MPGGIVNQYGSNQEGKIDQWMNVNTVRETAAISAQRFSSIRYIDFGKGIRLSASPFLRRITDPVPIFSGV